MKLSEAIRLGSMLKPQAFLVERGRQRKAGWRGWLLHETEETTCAFAAALDAFPCKTMKVSIDEGVIPLRGYMVATDGDRMTDTLILPTQWNDTVHVLAPCPVCYEHSNVYQTISHLNDFHRWTREQIADWVATIEPSETPSAEDSTDDGRGTTATDEPASVHARQGF